MKRLPVFNVVFALILTLNPLAVSVTTALPAEPHLESAEAPTALTSILPAWFVTGSQSNPSAPMGNGNALPGWFTSYNQPSAGPALGPVSHPLQVPIPQSLLAVNVFGPSVASLGSPPGSGEVYTAVIHNGSTFTAYNIYLAATHQSDFAYDGGDQILSDTGTLSFTTWFSATTITWTPVPTFNLTAGQTITVNFKLRAACDAQSGQQMRVGIYYNADPTQPPVELNDGGLNITTGRGNLVIKKEPSIQNLGSPDFGHPITWTVTVQNTGLGKLYGAVVTDTGGINLSQPFGGLNPTTTIPLLDINETRAYTVVGAVQACNLTNVARASWTCGNLAGDATRSNPISSTASILFSPSLPRINVQVSSPITFSYCAPLTRTVAATITNTGGPAGNFRLDSTFENDSFLDVVTPSVSAGWQYSPTAGLFVYMGGTPTGTIPGPTSAPVTLTFQVRPRSSVCAAGSGSIVFQPLYNDVCSGDPFSASPASLAYDYAQGQAPTLSIGKSGPAVVASGQVFSYQVTVSGTNPVNINGAIGMSDVLPLEFVLVGSPRASTGVVTVTGQTVAWTFDPPDTPSTFSQTLIYTAQVVLTRTLCGSGQQVYNNVRAVAIPTCPGCSPLNVNAQVNTIIYNNEGISSSYAVYGSSETCNASGLTLVSSFAITGSTVITWTGAAFTDAMGIDLGIGALPIGADPLQYVTGTLSVTVNGADYTSYLSPLIRSNGQLYIDLTALQAAGAPTQNVQLAITFTARITEASLQGAPSVNFNDWSQLYLPGVSDNTACATNNSFNQFRPLTIGRGDLSVSLAPQALNRCRTNTAIIYVNDNAPARLADHIVITFATTSVAEVMSARNFTFTGSLAGIPISIVTDTGGGRGVITFTLPAGTDLNGNGEIHFDLDTNCTETSVWNARITLLSQCALPHGNQAALNHVYAAPNLILFATPIEYTVRQKQAVWKFFVANNGNLAADSIIVTNSLNGIIVTNYAQSSGTASVTLSGALPITAPSAAVFTIANLPPNDAVEVTVTGTVFLCNPLWVDIAANLDCFGATCQAAQRHISFNTPDPYLLTNNGQTADLPMCDIGNVVFRTKNASSDVTLYQLDITETLRALTPDYTQPFTLSILDRNGALITTTTAFTPQIALSTTAQTLLVWKAISAPLGIFDSLDPLAVVVITVPVHISCVPPNSPQSFASDSAFGPCGKQLGYTEDAVTLQTAKPDMTIVKEGKGPTGSFEKTVYANPGDTVTWRIVVQNRPTTHAYVAHNVVLSDTWPVNFQFITATTGFSPTILIPSNTVAWQLGDVPVNNALTFMITGTLTGDACQLETVNATILNFGCGDGCSSAIAPMDTAYLNSNPALDVLLSPGPLQTCQGDIPITIRNRGATAYSNTLTVTLPSGYVYSETVSTGLTPTQIISSPGSPQFMWNLIPNRVNPAPYYEFSMTLRVRNSATSGACPVDNGRPVTATLQYDNSPACLAGGPFTATANTTLDVLSPQLQILKTPHVQTAAVGQRITWTLTLTNSGSGIAENTLVTDVVGSNYVSVTATGGGIVAGNTVTWTLGSVTAGGLWMTLVSAVLTTTGDNRNIVTATAGCATGCTSASATDTAFTTLVQAFDKGPAVQTGTIGSLVVFTFTTTLPDSDALYSSLTLTDALPTGLGYTSSVMTYAYDGDGSNGGPFTAISSTPALTPGWLASGNIIWRFGDLSGTVRIDGVITAVIQNIPTNSDGLRLNNIVTMTYTDSGQPYVHTDTAPVDILEPVLHLGKSYVTPYGCNATFLLDNFNRASASPPTGWTAGNGNWDNAPGTAEQTSNSTANAITYRNANANPNDFSYSAMVWSGDSTSSLGIVFRYQGAANYYRLILRLNDGGANINLQEFGGATPLNQTATFTPVPNHWYHLEVRMENNRIRGYVDGILYFDVVDASPQTGSNVGFYANNCAANACRFDDVLVTRLNQSACVVGANDLITYTLVVSNQNTLPGYDLVITDALPFGVSLVTYTLTSNATPTPLTTTEPTPIPGATGVLTWSVDRLAPTSPFTTLNHTALTLTVVLRVSPGITANVTLPNQAFLAYDNWPGSTQPTTITRQYSGGSHSTAVRTLDGSLTKTVTSSEFPTATLGSLVTYTLIVPSPMISATLYNVNLTDTLNPSMTIVAVATASGTGGLAGWSGQTVTATFVSVPSYTRAYVTITARISSSLSAYAGYLITNTAVMTHTTAPQITTTQPITMPVGEPRLGLVKASAPPTSNTVGAGYNVTYTVTITNWTGAYATPAYEVMLSDTLPQGMRQTAPFTTGITLNGSPVSGGYIMGYDATTGVFTIAFGSTFSVPVNSTLVITYVARIDAGVGVGLDLSNQALVGWSSLPTLMPGERNYGSIPRTTTVHTVWPSIAKTVTPPTATLGSLVTYMILLPQPPITATVYNAVVTDQLDPRVMLWAVDGGGFATTINGNLFTVTLGTIPAGEQRSITVTAVLSSPQGAVAGNTITNVAVLSHTTGLTTSNRPVFTVTEPSLALLKVSNPPTSNTVSAGQRITYTVYITNASNITASAAYDVSFTDTLPIGLRNATPALVTITLNGVPVSSGNYTINYNSATGLWTVTFVPAFAVPVGSVLAIQYAATVDGDVLAATDLTNVAQVTWSSLSGAVPGYRNYGPISGTTRLHTPLATALGKAVAPPSVTVGSQVIFSITVPGAPIGAMLFNVAVTDVVDGRLQIVEVSPPAAFNGQLVTATFTVIPTYTQQFVIITTTVRNLITVTNGILITDIASLNYSNNPTGTLGSPVVTTTVREPVITPSKLVQTPRAPDGAGDLVTYTLVLSNTGAWPAFDVLITDALPSGVEFLATQSINVTDPTTATTGASYPTWMASQLNVGGYIYITFTARVTYSIGAGLVLTNSTWGWYDTQPGNNPGQRGYPIPTATVPISTGQPALHLVKSATPSPVQAGGRLTYTLTVTNTGIVSATGVVITDVVPINTTFSDATSPFIGPDAGRVITWPLGTLDIGIPRVVTMVVTVNYPLFNGTLVTNTGWLTSTEGLTDTHTVTTPVTSNHTLAITKTAQPSPVPAGGQLSYTLTWSIAGNEPAVNVTLSDTVPSNTTFITATTPVIVNGRLLTWPLGDRNPGDAGSVTFTVRVESSLVSGTLLVNSALITDSQGVTNTDTVTTPVISRHALAITKTVNPSSVQPGGMLAYTLTWAVSGNEPAFNVTISDTVPANTTFVNATTPAIVNGRLLTWPLGNHVPGDTGLLTFTVQVISPLLSGTLILNSVFITDTQGVTDTDTITTPVISNHTLAITKTAQPALVQPGDTLFYTLTWSVAGNEPALNVTLSDTVPANTTFITATPPVVVNGELLTWSLGDHNPGDTGLVTFTVQVASPLLTGTLIVNGAIITDSQGITETDTVTTPVVSSHALAIAKMAQPSPVTAGNLLTYTLTWGVSGTEPAQNVAINDIMLPSATFQSCGPLPCGLSGSTVIWTLGTLNPPASGMVTLVVLVDASVLSGTNLLNSAIITDSQGISHTTTLTTPVQSSGDVAVTKLDNPDPVIPNTLLTYMLAVTNNGPSTAMSVVVTDTLPPEVTFISALPMSSSPSGANPITWSLGTLLPHQVRYLTVTTQVQPWVTQTFTNAVVAGSLTPDDNPRNNRDDEPTRPLTPSLVLVKSVTPGQAVRYQPFTYAIRITNTGQITFNPLALTDTLPPNFYYLVGSGVPRDPNLIAEPLLRWYDLGPLVPGAGITVSFAVSAATGITGLYTNTALVEGTTPAGVLMDTDQVPVVLHDPAVTIKKQIVAADLNLVAPNYITFAIAITNVGTSVIDVLPLVDIYDPYYLSFAGAVPAPDEPANDGSLAWYDLTSPSPHGFSRNLPPGAGFVVTTVFTVAHDINVTFNTVVISSGTDIYNNPTNHPSDTVPIVNIPTAIELLDFRADSVSGRDVRLAWATAVEIDNLGFNLYRANVNDPARADMIHFEPSTLRGGQVGATYSYTDTVTSEGMWWYWLADVDTRGHESIRASTRCNVEVNATLPNRIYLSVVVKNP